MIFDLLSDPKEEYGATLTPNAWVGGPMMKIVVEFEQSLKRHPPNRTQHTRSIHTTEVMSASGTKQT
jgi:hypothetical protein